MDERTGKLYIDPTDQEILDKQLRMLKNDEYDFLKGVPEEERPVMLALRDYKKTRAENGRHSISVYETVAFRLGFKAAKDLYAQQTRGKGDT